MIFYSRFFCTLLILLLAPLVSLSEEESSSPSERIFFETDTLTISEYDLRMYMERELDLATSDITWGSPDAVRASIENLYAYEILASELENEISEEQLTWIANFARTKAAALARLNSEVDIEMAAYDWESAAYEYYLANRADYVEPEKLKLRALLIDTKTRSEEEARAIVSELVPSGLSESEFEAIIREYTDDEVGATKGGLMTITRGRTVRPFEEAAFALTEPGQFSAPVTSGFGVHVIQLLERTPENTKSFDEVKAKLLPELKQIRRQEFYSALVEEAKARRPASLIIREAEIQAFMDEVAASAE